MVNIISVVKEKRDLCTIIFLWLMIWSGYNTGIHRFFDPGFPRSIFDAIHALRSVLPILAGLIATVLIIKGQAKMPKKYFTTPLGFFTVFTIVGILSSFVFSNNPLEAVYWGLMYGAVLLVLLYSLQNNQLHNIIKFNIIIAGTIALVLLLFFFIKAGSLNMLIDGSILCSERPYESIGDLKAGGSTLDMPGTRPTGLGRYAGIAALFLFAALFSEKYKKTSIALLFAFFCFIIFFAKGRAVLAAFSLSLIFIAWLLKPKIKWFLLIFGIIFLSVFLIFFNASCVYALQDNSVPVVQDSAANKSQIAIALYGGRELSSIITFSGRSTGVWHKSWDLFLGSPIIGYGFQADRFFLNGEHAHNTILHALVQGGLLGAIPFVIACLYCVFMVFRLYSSQSLSKEDRLILIQIIGILAFILVRGVTESFAYYSADWLFLAPIVAYIQYLYFSKNNG